MQNKQTFLWLDLEMTGLDPYIDTILEVALVITDTELNLIGKGINMPIFHPEEVLMAMDEWNRNTHTNTGLVQRVAASKWTMQAAEEYMLDYVQNFFSEKTTPLCGNTVWQDRMFLIRHMPKFNGYMHYRNIDVSTIKELSYKWYPDLKPFKKQAHHEALADIIESIEELRYYRQALFRQP